MDSVAVTVPLRPPTKKMKKRKELDALAPPHAISRRSSGKRSSQELLTDSSDDRSEYWNVSTRSGRKCRGRRTRACPGLLKACSAFLACASVLATASLIWLFIDVRQQLTALRTELDQVIAGSEGVPDALQKCHSLSRDLQNNQTIIFSHLSDFKLQINNFTIQVAAIQHGLHQVQEWFQDAPELRDVPKDLKTLSGSVLSLGSQIQDLGATVKTLKETSTRVQGVQSTMQQNISSIKHSVLELTNIIHNPQMLTTNETKIKTDELNAAILHLTNNLTRINETLSTLLQWASKYEREDHEKLTMLQNTTQDITAKLTSLQRDCAKATEETALAASVQIMSDQIMQINATNLEVTGKLKQLEESYGMLWNSTNGMLLSNSSQQQQDAKGKVMLYNGDTAREIDHDVVGASQRKSLTKRPKHFGTGQDLERNK